MKVYLAAIIASLFTVAVATQISERAFAGSYTALFVLTFIAATIASLVTARVAQGASSDTAADNQPRTRRSESGRPSGTDREDGVVKWFNRTKGFGFIIRENGEEIFVHHRSIRSSDGRRANLRDGQQVSFVAVEREKGWQAEDVEAA